jgi:hypothetical protein
MIENCSKCWKVFNRTEDRSLCEACYWHAQLQGQAALKPRDGMAPKPLGSMRKPPKRTHLTSQS